MNQEDELILGISCIDDYTHDNSIAILKKGRILFAASEERYTRIKHDGSFPQNAIKSGLNYLKINLSSIKLIAVGYPKRKVLSILVNKYFYEVFPFVIKIIINRHLKLLYDLVPIAKLIYQKTSLKNNLRFIKNKKIVYIDHHLSHAASAYYTSGFNKCICLALDAFGSNFDGKIRSGAVFLCQDGSIREIMNVPIYASLGLFYQSVTYALGFKPGDGEGKTMGLAAYGNPKKVYELLKPYCPSFLDGTWMKAKDWLSGIIPSIPKLAYLFKTTQFGNLLKRLILQGKKEDVAATAQKILEEELVKLIKFLIKKYPGYKNICLAGGIYLNVKANKKISEIKGVDNVFIHPNASDGGTALGAAFTVTPHKYLQKIPNEALVSCGLGESFTNKEISQAFKAYNNKITYKKYKNIVGYTVDRLLEQKVIGWFQGRAEWGPRALGFRSVLADPRKLAVKDRINKVLKNREWFMPFAPSILEEQGGAYFKNFRRSTFMTIVFDVVPGKEKLFKAALHIDNTARPNTVNKENNPLYYKLLKGFYKKTGLPILLNTSFNRHGLPIVNTPYNAIDHLITGAVDELIIGDYSVTRNE